MAILIAVCIVVLVIAFNDWTKEKQFRDLQAKLESEHKISVLRDGHIQEIAVKELLVGDVAYLTYGNIVPADGLIIESNNLRIDESVLTGESDLVEKNSSAPIVFNSMYFIFKFKLYSRNDIFQIGLDLIYVIFQVLR